MNNILLVEDNERIQKLNKEFLEEEGGYITRLAMNLAEAEAAVAESKPDIIVLDIMLPDGSGLDFLRRLRRQDMDMPVLLLTALSEPNDEIKGIRMGGDDYIAKPYDRNVLLARIEKLLAKRQRADERVEEAKTKTADIVQYGALTVNRITHRAYLHGEDALLTPREFVLLLYFLNNEGKRLTPKEIYEAVWGYDSDYSAGTVRVHIARLRKKLKLDIETTLEIETVGRKSYVCTVVSRTSIKIC